MVTAHSTLRVPHLGELDVGYQLSAPNLSRSKPTIILFNPFTTTVAYYRPEFENAALLDAANLVAIEPLGHGQTKGKYDSQFTYWDSAIMSLQVMDRLEIDAAFVLGTSQGGWIAARMAILAPARVKGTIIIGSSMDSESVRSREAGCWDAPSACAGLLSIAGNMDPVHDFEPGQAYCDFLMDIGFGNTVDQATANYWAKSLRENYSGHEGKSRMCMATVNLVSRDGLYERLPYVRCPVLWLHGTNDVVFSLRNAESEIKLFVNSADAKLISLEGGVHFLSFTHAKQLHQELLDFVDKWKGQSSSSL